MARRGKRGKKGEHKETDAHSEIANQRMPTVKKTYQPTSISLRHDRWGNNGHTTLILLPDRSPCSSLVKVPGGLQRWCRDYVFREPRELAIWKLGGITSAVMCFSRWGLGFPVRLRFYLKMLLICTAALYIRLRFWSGDK